jgi:hypothetical protein
VLACKTVEEKKKIAVTSCVTSAFGDKPYQMLDNSEHSTWLIPESQSYTMNATITSCSLRFCGWKPQLFTAITVI